MSGHDIYNTAALTPPPGVKSDFTNSYTLHPYLIATVALCLTISTIAVTARSYTKKQLLHKFEIEDCECQAYTATSSR